ncbi:hypothetical protein D3C85_475380 [compost metagenome]
MVVVGISGIAWSATSLLPGKMLLEMEYQGPSKVNIHVPLAPLDAAIQEGIRNSSTKDPSINYNLISAGFKEFVNGSVTIAYSVHLQGKINPINQGFDCEFLVRFAIPHTLIPDVMTQDLNSATNCTSNAIINFMPLISSVITSALRSGLTRSLIDKSDPNNNFIALKNEDPALYGFLTHGHIQGAYCRFQAMEGLCLRIGWLQTSVYSINSYMQKLIGQAPISTSPIGTFDFDSEIARFRAISHFEPSRDHLGYAFPAKYHPLTSPPEYDSGDMSLFGGLLCIAGVSEGCELVRRSQGPDGRFWRSPNHIGDVGTDTFTGDQINGVFLYFATQRDPVAFSRYLDFLRTNAQPVPSVALPLDTAYRSCRDDPLLKCLLAGSEWLVLNSIASQYGLETEIPADVRNATSRFGDQFDDLVWPAMFAPRGYELHLISMKISVARLLGHRTRALKMAAAIISAREPENPFFRYLHLGPDQSILTKLSSKCYIDPNRRDYYQWQWERSEIDIDQSGQRPWEASMGWDCVFMYSLLRNRVPIGP